MTWKCYSLRVTTGEVGSPLDLTKGTWSIDLNKTPSGDVTAKKKQLLKLDWEWWAPWSGGVLWTFTYDGVEYPWEGGPFTDAGDEDLTTMSFPWGGIRAVLEHRHLERDLEYKGLSLGSIAWAVVQEGMDKPGGALPIVHGSPDETRADGADHQRTYERFNFSNNNVDKRLTELSNVRRGPDIMFRPRWTDDSHTRIEWVMVHGTERNPRILQTWTPDFDMTPARSGIYSPSVTTSADHIADRVIATGSGEGDGTAIAIEQDLSAIAQGRPFLEKVISNTDQEDEARLAETAAGELAVSRRPLTQLTMSVRANDPKFPVGSYHVGDAANVITPKGAFVALPGRSYDMRVIKMSGGTDNAVSLDFQEDYFE
jgi:hypothetical protein